METKDEKGVVERLTKAYETWTTAGLTWRHHKTADNLLKIENDNAREALHQQIAAFSDDELAPQIPSLKNVTNEDMSTSLVQCIYFDALSQDLHKTHQTCLANSKFDPAYVLIAAARGGKLWAVHQILEANKVLHFVFHGPHVNAQGKWAVSDICDTMGWTDHADILKVLRTVRDKECVCLNHAYGSELEARLPQNERDRIARWCDK